MRKQTVVGLDIGTHHVKVVVAQTQHNGAPPHIIGTGSAISHGLRHGYVVSRDDIVESIKKAIAHAEHEASIAIKRAYVAIGGVGLEDKYSHGEAIVSRANAEVTEVDTENALAEAEARISRELRNYKIIHAIPVSYLLDGQQVLGRPIGMHGAKLEVEAMFVTVLEQHLNDMIAAINDAGVEVIDIMAAPIAASLVTLTKQQKMVGCVLANLGAETTSIVVFEENTPIALKVFSVGSSDITNEIAISFRVPPAEAEQVKRGVVTGTPLSAKKLDDIMAVKFRQMFSLIQTHLKKINRAGLLPAGVILTGGGSGASALEDHARNTLKIPSETAGLRLGEQRLKDASWAVAYGLCLWGASSDADTIGIENAQATGMRILSWFKQFLP